MKKEKTKFLENLLLEYDQFILKGTKADSSYRIEQFFKHKKTQYEEVISKIKKTKPIRN